MTQVFFPLKQIIFKWRECFKELRGELRVLLEITVVIQYPSVGGVGDDR